MRFSANHLLNGIAWAILIGIVIPVVFVMVYILGAFGLILVGLFTLFICTTLSLYDEAPLWSDTGFRSVIKGRTLEERAAQRDDKQVRLSPLNFYRWCGVVLIIAGIAGCLWQGSAS